MGIEQKLANLMLDTLLKVGKRPGDPDVLEAMKDAVWSIYQILGREGCTGNCRKCTNPDCPVRRLQR